MGFASGPPRGDWPFPLRLRAAEQGARPLGPVSQVPEEAGTSRSGVGGTPCGKCCSPPKWAWFLSRCHAIVGVFVSFFSFYPFFFWCCLRGCEKQVSLPGHSLLDGTIVRARDSSWAEQFSAGPFSAQSGWYWIRGVFQMGSDRFSGLRLTSHFRKFRSAFCSFWMMERLLCFVNFVNILITRVYYTSLFPTYSVITCVTGWSFYIDLFNFNENFKKRSLSRSISPKAGRESHGGAAERPAAEERREGPPRRRPRGDGPEGGTGQWSGLPPVGR